MIIPDKKILLTNLASTTGRNVAIFLQELHYVTKSQNKQLWRGGYQYWQRNHFPFWSLRTTERVIRAAEEMGLVYVRFEGKKGYDSTLHTKSYGINYDAVANMENRTGSLILDDTPLPFSVAAAKLFAATPNLTLNDVFVLFEIRYWMKAEEKKYKKFKSKNTFDGDFWDLKRLSDLQKRLPFLSRRTVERCIKRLREAGYIRTELTRLRTLAFTIITEKMNGIEGIDDSLKAPKPPRLRGKWTKFYDNEYQMLSNDFYYLYNAFNGIRSEQGDDKWYRMGILNKFGENNQAVRDECSRQRQMVAWIVRKIGKHRLMDFIRNPEFTNDLIKGDWSELYEASEELAANLEVCWACGDEYDCREGCYCEASGAVYA